MAGVPQSRFTVTQRAAQTTAYFRWPQPLRSGMGTRPGVRVPRHRTGLAAAMGASVRYRDYVDRVAAARILVVGDVMLDRYWFGDVERISPEAPVPVVKIDRMEERLGGAANVA